MTNTFAKAPCGALLLAIGALALSSAAQAATSTATGTAAMGVINECSVTGSNVNLGTYSTNQTVGDLAADLGYLGGAVGDVFYPGATADGAMTLGSVTCDAGVPYSLRIDVANAALGENLMGFRIGSETLAASIWANKIGDQALGSNYWGSVSNWWMSAEAASAVGTGAQQQIKGNIFVEPVYSSLALGDKLGIAGTYSEPMFYTLNF